MLPNEEMKKSEDFGIKIEDTQDSKRTFSGG